MTDVQQLQQRLNWANKRVSYAWAKYYESMNERHATDYNHYRVVYRNSTLECIPEHIKAELKSMADTLKKQWECPICLDFIEQNSLDITNCGHFYCKECITRHKETQRNAGKDKWSCATCRKEHSF